MSLIALCCFSTKENGKDEYLEKTLNSLKETVDFSKHRLQVSVNGFTIKTVELLANADFIEKVYWNETNIGTAKGINKVWANRCPKEHCHKIDDDIETHYKGWLDELEEVLEKDHTIGQAGLKRHDLWENPAHENEFYRSKLIMLPHTAGERWVVCEEVNHVMGSSALHSYRLLDKVGGLVQPKCYGLDDALMSARSKLAGFKNVFLPHIPIAHLDTGSTPYQKEKENIASQSWGEYHRLLEGYNNGTISLYHEFE